MGSKIARIAVGIVVAVPVFYYKGPVLAVLTLTAVPNLLAYAFPEAGKTNQNRKMLAMALVPLALLLSAQYFPGSRFVRLSLVSAGVGLMVLWAVAPLVPLVRRYNETRAH